MNKRKVPKIRFKGFYDDWEQRKFEEIAVRSSVICSDANLPRVEYEDIVSGAGRLNKDIYAKESSKSGIAFHQGDVLYGKLRPYLQNWLLPAFEGLAVGDFWVLQPQNADSSFLYRLIQSRQFDEVANQSEQKCQEQTGNWYPKPCSPSRQTFVSKLLLVHTLQLSTTSSPFISESWSC